MEFAGLNYLFIRAIMYTGGGEGGRYRKKLRLMSSVQDKGRTQDLGHSFFLLQGPTQTVNNCFLSPGIAGLNLEKETGKKSIMLTKYHVVLLKASSCGCKILFFTLPILV